MDCSTNDESIVKNALKSNDSEDTKKKEVTIVNELREIISSDSKENTLADIVSIETNTRTSDDIINGVNDKVLLDVLSPEVKKNEKTKRFQKWCLIICLTGFLIFQFYAVFHFTDKIISYSVNRGATNKIVDYLLKFDVAYISSVVIELIAIVKYIVENVFDTSITELIKIFKSNSNDEKEQEKG